MSADWHEITGHTTGFTTNSVRADALDSVLSSIKKIGLEYGHMSKPLPPWGMPTFELPNWKRTVVRYRLPDGRLVKSRDVQVKTRFIDYTPEDIDHLLFMGVIAKESVEVDAWSNDDDTPMAFVVNCPGYAPSVYAPRAVLAGGWS